MQHWTLSFSAMISHHYKTWVLISNHKHKNCSGILIWASTLHLNKLLILEVWSLPCIWVFHGSPFTVYKPEQHRVYSQDHSCHWRPHEKAGSDVGPVGEHSPSCSASERDSIVCATEQKRRNSSSNHTYKPHAQQLMFGRNIVEKSLTSSFLLRNICVYAFNCEPNAAIQR